MMLFTVTRSFTGDTLLVRVEWKASCMDSFYGIFVSFLELESLLSLFGKKQFVRSATQKIKKSF